MGHTIGLIIDQSEAFARGRVTPAMEAESRLIGCTTPRSSRICARPGRKTFPRAKKRAIERLRGKKGERRDAGRTPVRWTAAREGWAPRIQS